MLTRKEVFEAIDSERIYQEKWDKEREENPNLGSYNDRDKPVETWILWMEEYINKARHSATANFDKSTALENVCKIAALATACMEYHGVVKRLN